MTVIIEREAFSTELFDEIVPLGKKCWNESTIDKADTCAYYGERDFEIEPDISQYLRIEKLGLMIVITLRSDSVLKGYLVGFINRSLHHKHILSGITDSIYIEPEYRVYAGVVAEKFEKELKAMGAGIIGWPTHTNGPMYQILKSLGYVGDDIVMEKRLCV